MVGLSSYCTRWVCGVNVQRHAPLLDLGNLGTWGVWCLDDFSFCTYPPAESAGPPVFFLLEKLKLRAGEGTTAVVYESFPRPL